MKPIVVPTIFALDKETFERKLKNVSFSSRIHLDFMDGKFVEGVSIPLSQMSSIKNLNHYFGLHLMAFEPHKYLKSILNLGIQKVLIHKKAYEKEEDLLKAKNKFKENNLEIFLVINPDVEIEEIVHLLNEFDGIMLMSVWPGKEGQEFIENTFNKIKEIRKIHPTIPIQVDGGINTSNIKELVDLEANILSVGSFISSADNPKENYKKLISIIKN